MKGVILAAGFGQRLRSPTRTAPKPIVEIADRPLITYTIDALLSAGVEDLAVVVGYEGRQVMEAIRPDYPDVAFYENEMYDGGNALSVLAAREFTGDDPFVVCMADHAVGTEIPKRLLARDVFESALCVDPLAQLSSQLDDATKVVVDRYQHIVRIGKGLDSWNAVDTGVFMMMPDVFDTIGELMGELGPRVTITNVVRHMAGLGYPFAACNVGGLFWADVDTPDDYESVDRLLRERNGERI